MPCRERAREASWKADLRLAQWKKDSMGWRAELTWKWEQSPERRTS